MNNFAACMKNLIFVFCKNSIGTGASLSFLTCANIVYCDCLAGRQKTCRVYFTSSRYNLYFGKVANRKSGRVRFTNHIRTTKIHNMTSGVCKIMLST